MKQNGQSAMPVVSSLVPPQRSGEVSSVETLHRRRFPQLTPIRFYSAPRTRRRVTIVTDSVSSGSLFGGVGTSLIFGALLAEHSDADLRIITRTETPNRSSFLSVIRANGIRFERDVEFDFFPPSRTSSIDRAPAEVFISTSWWTTACLSASVSPSSIIYLLQEDERLFYPNGDERLLCSTCIADRRIFKVVNTVLLRRHLVGDGLLDSTEGNVAFEPAFFRGSFFWDDSTRAQQDKKRLLFYARPTHPRNLYLLGLRVLDEAVNRSLIDPAEWEILFVGTEDNQIILGGTVEPKNVVGLSWTDYAKLVRSADIGLCLMSSPHPSYPPLDMTASGAVVLTNSYGIKESLDFYSKNILVREPYVDQMMRGLSEAIALAGDLDRRRSNFEKNNINTDWTFALSEAVNTCARRLWNRV